MYKGGGPSGGHEESDDDLPPPMETATEDQVRAEYLQNLLKKQAVVSGVLNSSAPAAAGNIPKSASSESKQCVEVNGRPCSGRKSDRDDESTDDCDEDDDDGTDCEDDDRNACGDSKHIPAGRSKGDVNEDPQTFECLCVGCSVEFRSLNSVLQHMLSYHDFDLFLLAQKFEMDFLSYARLVNYLRHVKNLLKEQPSHPDLVPRGWNWDSLDTLFTVEPKPWEDDKWLATYKEDDGLLTLYFDESYSSVLEKSSGQQQRGGDVGTDGEGDSQKLTLQQEVEELRSALERTVLEQETMKKVMARMVGVDDKVDPRKVASVKKNESRNDGEAEMNEMYYFESYDECDIHSAMLNDNARTLAYKDAILKNRPDFENKTVMDLGCGTGILSMFCAQAGAKTVHAIDCSNIIYEAMDIIFENDLNKQIQCHKGKLETLGLQIDKVDVLVSEWMGYFLVFEGMLNSYLYARDKFLKPGGKMLPSSATISIVAISDEDTYSKEVEMWDEVHGFKMSAMKKKALKEPSVQVIPPAAVVSEEVLLKDLNLHTCSPTDVDIDGTYEFRILKDCSLTAVGGYFSCGFDDGDFKVQLPTSPSDTPTHWKQSIFFLPHKVNVKKGETVPVKFVCKAHPENPRWLRVQLTIEKISTTYDFR